MVWLVVQSWEYRSTSPNSAVTVSEQDSQGFLSEKETDTLENTTPVVRIVTIAFERRSDNFISFSINDMSYGSLGIGDV